MLTILVADSTREFCSAVSEAFSGKYKVLSCGDGRTALKLLFEHEPDILWLDVMLPGMDGLTILQTAAMQGTTPKVIASIRHESEYVIRALERLSVSLVLQRPTDLAAAVAQLDALAADILRERGSAVATADQLTYEMLLLLGLTGKRYGYKYLYAALLQKVLDPDSQITKSLYPDVAAKCGGNPQSVERAIRGAISEAWENRHGTHWELYFPDYPVKSPSNGVVVDRLAERIQAALQRNNDKTEPPASE